MFEYKINLHMHTVYSDGRGTHQELAEAAIRAGLDAIIVTDHNRWVEEAEAYYGKDPHRVLVLVGEEIHDPNRVPQKNHLLVFGVKKELNTLASTPQKLLNTIKANHGLSFIAHPYDPASETFGEENLSWVEWDLTGFTGIELWNAMSEFKGKLSSYLPAIFYAFNFKLIAQAPFQESIQIYDRLLNQGKKVVAVGGSDAHQLLGKLGPIKKELFPYEWHFKAINTHILSETPLTGKLEEDRHLIYTALGAGKCFIGNDLAADTKGFRYSAKSEGQTAEMGDSIPFTSGLTLHVQLPKKTNLRILRNGDEVLNHPKTDQLSYLVEGSGVYRVEAYIHYKWKKRAWIFSNPIYITEAKE